MRYLFSLILVLSSCIVLAQNGKIQGTIFNEVNNEPVPFATVYLEPSEEGVSADLDGRFTFEGLTPGLYNIKVSAVGFESKTIFEVSVSNSRVVEENIGLREQGETLEEVTVKASPFVKKEESPLSVRNLGVAEIERYPGGNRDISKVIQSLPGVSSTASFRNDIIIRGGAPNENRFYLDGIEVPNINHFATQGASGGPVGMLNVNFIREVDFYSSAFPAARGNALSSVFEFKQKDGNPEKMIRSFTLGSSDVGLTIDGPIGDKSDYIFSIRRSYLQFLFAALKLPFLPTYNDVQMRFKTKLSDKEQLIVMGLGALDQFAINTEVNEGVTDPEIIERNQFILGNIPVNDQWNYAVGANYKRFGKNGFTTFVMSRNHLNNESYKYLNNDESSEDNLLLNYNSQEIENKLRLERTYRKDKITLNTGVGYEYATYTNSTYLKTYTPQGNLVVDFNSILHFSKFYGWIQYSQRFLSNRLLVSTGIRLDANTYSKDMLNPFNQFSPRLALSYNLTENMTLNANVARYYQLPAYTVLGYRDGAGTLVNRENDVQFIGTNHAVAGIEVNTSLNSRFTVESFYKTYNNYPFLLSDSISLANLGGDFGVVGNEPVVPTSNGRAYGLELLYQQKLFKGFFGIVAVTLVRSEFEDRNQEFIPSAWDNGIIVSVTAGKKFKGNWDVGARFRYSGGTPYTPYDTQASSLKNVWEITQQGVLDYTLLNTERLPAFHNLDIRVDKKWFWDKVSLNLYLDIQNVYGFKATNAPILNVLRDANGQPLEDPNDPNRYSVYLIRDESGNVLPSIGLILEF